MRKLVVALAAVPAVAQVGFHAGPGAVYIDPQRPYYDYEGGCRVVITHHFNRWGNEVSVRRRICD